MQLLQENQELQPAAIRTRNSSANSPLLRPVVVRATGGRDTTASPMSPTTSDGYRGAATTSMPVMSRGSRINAAPSHTHLNRRARLSASPAGSRQHAEVPGRCALSNSADSSTNMVAAPANEVLTAPSQPSLTGTPANWWRAEKGNSPRSE